MSALLGVLQSWRRLLLLLPLTIVIVALITGYFDESFRPNLYLPFSPTCSSPLPLPLLPPLPSSRSSSLSSSSTFPFPSQALSPPTPSPGICPIRSSNRQPHPLAFRPQSIPSFFSGSRGPIYQECVTPPTASDRPPTVNAFDLVPDLLRQLWAPLIVPLTEPSFTTRDGTVKKLPEGKAPIHTHPLGKRICILDVDTRALSEEGNIFAPTLPKFSNIKLQTAGYLSHYLYAMIHGYTYKFLRVPAYKDRAPHWTKIIFTQELLKEFDIVVMLDYDTMFPSPQLPLEWMLNYWQIDRDVIVAMAEDPDAGHNLDRKGNINVNTGFIIAQSMGSPEKTQELFKDWAECPEEKRYKGCAKYKDVIFHEQSGFSSFVRYDFLKEKLSFETPEGQKYVRKLPCSEANGIPDVEETGCTGHLVRHFWGNKFATPRELSEGILENLVPLLTKAAFGDVDVVRDYRGMVLEGDQILDVKGLGKPGANHANEGADSKVDPVEGKAEEAASPVAQV